jgi:hypothetical protein
VVDRKTLNLAILSVGSFFGTVIPVILALMPDPPAVVGANVTCLTMEQYIDLGKLVTENNTCVPLNLTVASILAL